MDRKERVTIDCRDYPETKCSLSFSGTEDEVMEIAEYHAVNKHGFKSEPGLRDQLRSMIKREAFSR
ncbi:MAG: DUF1059 domain-containing protein [Elusimicrobia bacterium]|nr:DUF1059 domain-containing protein [Elusimicrobiota bacterium]